MYSMVLQQQMDVENRDTGEDGDIDMGDARYD